MLAVVQEKTPSSKEMATLICTILYEVLAPVKVYPALTGGCLYKDGPRKDMDIVLYRDRSVKYDPLMMNKVAIVLQPLGFSHFEFFGWCTKCKYKGYSIDLFDPEAEDGEYPIDEDDIGV